MVRQGDVAAEMYFVGEGTLEVRLHEDVTGHPVTNAAYRRSPETSKQSKGWLSVGRGKGVDESSMFAESSNGSRASAGSAAARAAGADSSRKGGAFGGQGVTRDDVRSGKDNWTFVDELEAKPYRYA